MVGKFLASGENNAFLLPTANAFPDAITVGSDGNLWFTELNANKIGRVTNAGVVKEFSTPSMGRLSGITAGPDGNLWYVRSENPAIGRMTTAGVATEFPITGGSPMAITAGPDGNLWVADFAGAAWRVPPGDPTRMTKFPLRGSPNSIAAGADGNIWVGVEFAQSLFRIKL